MSKPPEIAELKYALEQVFSEPVMNLRRQPSDYSSTFPIEHLHIAFAGGREVSVVFKNLARHTVLEDASRVKPEFLYDPRREIGFYRHLQPALNLGSPKPYGAWNDWLFLERVEAPELYQIGEFEVWLEAARWLARFHSATASDPAVARSLVPELLHHDAAFYDAWLQRARRFCGSKLDPIVESYAETRKVLIEMPRSLIHGEFYASNVLIQGCQDTPRICPVDWEMAAIGPGLLDLAALASGKWNRRERLMMLDAYATALSARLRPPDLEAAFECAQLQIALQWLGWADGWSPYKEHAHDWEAEALRAHSSLVAAHANSL